MKTKAITTGFFAIVAACILLLTSCEKDPVIPPVLPENPKGNLEIRFMPTMNNVPLEINSLFQGPNGLRMLVETFKVYLSDIQAESQGNVLGEKDIDLVDFSLSDKSITFECDPGTIDKLNFSVGLSPQQNGTNDPDFNPAAYENSHPLSIYNNMYWSWASGYIFLKIEARIDTSSTQDVNPNFTCFYHCGLDTLKRNHSISGLNAEIQKGSTTVVELAVEFNDIFNNNGNTINMVDDYFTHTSDNMELAKQVIENFGTAIRKL
jgi:hypothetical protein